SIIFFFSSRRRHTRLQGDWSSDVCSSDLGLRRADAEARLLGGGPQALGVAAGLQFSEQAALQDAVVVAEGKPAEGADAGGQLLEIGRASCRERVEIRVGAGGCKSKRRRTV